MLIALTLQRAFFGFLVEVVDTPKEREKNHIVLLSSASRRSRIEVALHHHESLR